jgi:hypothetical protein
MKRFTSFFILVVIICLTSLVNAQSVTMGSAGQFEVNSTGNIVKINNVTTSFPSSQGASNSYLTNNGSGTMSWSTTLPGASNAMMTSDGGYALYMQNDATATITQYSVVAVSTTTDNRIMTAPVNCDVPIGVANADIAPNAWGWVVVTGIATVRTAGDVTRGYYAYVSETTAGAVLSSNTVAAGLIIEKSVISWKRKRECLRQKSSFIIIRNNCK